MARREKTIGSSSAPWLLTFSDLMILLLTFFVLLLSMSSIDKASFSRIALVPGQASMIPYSAGNRPPERVRLLLNILQQPEVVPGQLETIKNLIFPPEVLPAGVSPDTLKDIICIFAHQQGIVIALTEEALFPEGTSVLEHKAKGLLQAVVPFLRHSAVDVKISGHTDDALPAGVDPYALSGQRAMSVLEYFMQQNVKPSRFSISGYGPDRPLFPNDGPVNRSKNRRVELLLKTARRLGQYG